jgi:hypothetical protein
MKANFTLQRGHEFSVFTPLTTTVVASVSVGDYQCSKFISADGVSGVSYVFYFLIAGVLAANNATCQLTFSSLSMQMEAVISLLRDCSWHRCRGSCGG